MTEMQDWVRVWIRRNDHEFEEAKRGREVDQSAIEKGLPPDVVEMCARFDLERHRRNQFPVGALLDSIDKRRHNGQKPSADKLLVVAEVGKELLYEAICAADEDDNEEFFVQAYESAGALVDNVLEQCGRECRNSLTGCRWQSG